VIHDLVLPIVIRELNLMGAGIPSYAVPHDEALEDFLDEQLSIILGVCGGVRHCEELEKAIKEAKQRDPEGFRQLIRKLLRKYINLKKVLLQAKIEKKRRRLEGPPDRFKELREKAKYVWRVY